MDINTIALALQIHLRRATGWALRARDEERQRQLRRILDSYAARTAPGP